MPSPAYLSYFGSGGSYTPTGGTSGQSYAETVIGLSPTGYWRCGDASGAVQDSSGNGNHMTVTGGTPAYGETGWAGDGGDAILFDGSTDYFRDPDDTWQDVGTNDLSVAMCVKMSSWPSVTANLLGHDGGGTAGEWAVQFDGTADEFRLKLDATEYNISVTADLLDDGDWHHCVIAFDRSGNAQAWVDNSSMGTVDISGKSAVSLTNAVACWLGEDFAGSLCEIAFWNGTLLDADDVATLYNAKDGTGGGSDQASAFATEVLTHSPLGYWKMDEGTGATVMADSSGNSHDGTYSNSPTLGVSGPMTGATGVTFDGSTSYASVPYHADFDWAGNEDWSVVLWFKSSSWTYPDTILGRTGDGDYGQWEVRPQAADQLRCRIYDAAETTATDILSASTTDLDTGAWHMLALCVDISSATGGQWYLDGSTYGTATDVSGADHARSGGTWDLYLGRRRSAGLEWPGTMCQVAIFDSVLSSSDISDLWTAGGGS